MMPEPDGDYEVGCTYLRDGRFIRSVRTHRKSEVQIAQVDHLGESKECRA